MDMLTSEGDGHGHGYGDGFGVGDGGGHGLGYGSGYGYGYGYGDSAKLVIGGHELTAEADEWIAYFEEIAETEGGEHAAA